MQFRVLGPLEVWREGARLNLGRRKQRAVLAMLLLQPNRVVSAERIMDQLWPDDAPASASASLHAYISNLRRLIEPERAPRAPARILVSRAPGYTVVADEDSLDMLQFEALVDAGRAAMVVGDYRGAATCFTDALALWRGPMVLGDFADEAFSVPASARLTELRLSATESRIDAWLALHDDARVVAELEPLVAEHPLRERLWGQLMVALYRTGRQADALRAYQRARTVLGDELGVEPGPELRRLEQAVLDHAEELTVVDASPGALPADSARSSTVMSSRTLTPVVGRARELSVLDEAMRDVAAGAKRFVVIAGEAGVGKTALAQACLERAGALGFAVSVGRCPESGATLPLWPWGRAFRDLPLEGVPGPLRNLLAAGHEVGPVLRSGLFESIVSFLLDADRTTPVALLLDDLQWADDASHHVLRLLVNEPARGRLLVLTTYRDPALLATAPLDETLATLARSPDDSRIALGGLDVDAMGALVELVSGSAGTVELARTLHERTHGNPFYASEIARLLSTEHAIEDADRLARIAIPSTVRDVVRAHIAQLPEQVAALLSVAAVIGPDIETRLVAAITSVVEESVLASFDIATIAGLLIEHPEEIGWYRFAHDLVRDAIYDALSSSRRARIHEQALDALIELYGEQSSLYTPTIAYHAQWAVSRIGVKRAVRYIIQAARLAQMQLALDQAIGHLERANELLSKELDPSTRGALELECIARLAQLFFLRDGNTAEVRSLYERIRVLAERVDTEARAEALFSEATNVLLLGDLAEARSAGEELLVLGHAEGNVRWQINGEVCLSVLMWTGSPADARHHLERSLASAFADPGYGAPSGRAGVPIPIQKARLALVLALLDEDTAAVDVAKECLIESAGDRQGWSLAWAALHCALVFAILDRPRDVLRVVAGAAEATGIAYVDAALATCEAWANARLGEVEAAGGAARVRLERARLARAGDGLLQVPLAVLEADLLVDAGRHEEAAAIAREARARLDRIGEATWDAEVARVMVRARPHDRVAQDALRAAVARAEAANVRYFARRAGCQLDLVAER